MTLYRCGSRIVAPVTERGRSPAPLPLPPFPTHYSPTTSYLHHSSLPSSPGPSHHTPHPSPSSPTPSTPYRPGQWLRPPTSSPAAARGQWPRPPTTTRLTHPPTSNSYTLFVCLCKHNYLPVNSAHVCWLGEVTVCAAHIHTYSTGARQALVSQHHHVGCIPASILEAQPMKEEDNKNTVPSSGMCRKLQSRTKTKNQRENPSGKMPGAALDDFKDLSAVHTSQFAFKS